MVKILVELCKADEPIDDGLLFKIWILKSHAKSMQAVNAQPYQVAVGILSDTVIHNDVIANLVVMLLHKKKLTGKSEPNSKNTDT